MRHYRITLRGSSVFESEGNNPTEAFKQYFPNMDLSSVDDAFDANVRVELIGGSKKTNHYYVATLKKLEPNTIVGKAITSKSKSKLAKNKPLCTFSLIGHDIKCASSDFVVIINDKKYKPKDCVNIACNPGDKIIFKHDSLAFLRFELNHLDPNKRRNFFNAEKENLKVKDIDAMLAEYDKNNDINKIVSVMNDELLTRWGVSWGVLDNRFILNRKLSIEEQNYCHIIVPKNASGNGSLGFTQDYYWDATCDFLTTYEDCGWTQDCEPAKLGK